MVILSQDLGGGTQSLIIHMCQVSEAKMALIVF